MELKVSRSEVSNIKVLSPNDINLSKFEGLKNLATANQEFVDDLMFIRFILLHEGPNSNGDYFTRDEMSNAWWTWINKPVTWEHGQPYIGFITDAMLVSPAETGPDPRWYIECAAVIWKARYPFESSDIIHGHEDGSYRMSMEAYFKDALYALGDNLNNLYTYDEAPYLADLRGMQYDGQDVYRVLINVTGAGVGVVSDPADEDAIILDVVASEENDNIHIDHEQAVAYSVVYHIGDIIKLEESSSKANKKEDEKNMDIEKLKGEVSRLESELEKINAEKDDLQKEVDKLKSEKDAIASTLDEKEKELVDMAEGMKSLTKDFNDYKEQVENEKAEAAKDKLAEGRLAEIVSAGVEVNDEKKVELLAQFRELPEEMYASIRDILIENVKGDGGNEKGKFVNVTNASINIESNHKEHDLLSKYEEMWDKVLSESRIGSELN